VLTPTTLKHYIEASQLEEKPHVTDATEIFQTLLRDYETVIQYLRTSIPVVIDENGDEATGDFLIGQMADLEKTAWMIRSMNM
jgi:starvation-inducible DNA-binding protein